MTDFTITSVAFTNEVLPTAGGGKTNKASDGSIGAPILCTIVCTAASDIEQMRWYINPALFIPSGAIPVGASTTDYLCEIDGNPSIGTIFPMPLYTGGSPYEPSNRNLTCELEKTDDQEVTIRLRFRLTMDMNGLVSGQVVTNRDRLLKTQKNSPATVIVGDSANVLPSVYRSAARKAHFRIKMMDGLGDTTTKTSTASYAARWYVKGLPNDTNAALPAEFPETSINDVTFGLFRGGVEVSGLSQYETTEVRMWWPYDAGTATKLVEEKIFAYLIRTDLVGNVASWLDDYGCEGGAIDSSTVDGVVISGPLKCMQPHQETATIDAVPSIIHRFTADVTVDPAGTYAAIFIVGGHPASGSTDNTFTNSFILADIPANDPPAAIAVLDEDFSGTLIDYNIDPLTDNVISTVVDNVVARVTFDPTTYEGLKVGHPAALGWEEDLDRVQITISNAAGSVIFATRIFNKVGGVFVGAGGANANNLVVTEAGGNFTYQFELHNCMRNLVGLADFGGETLRIRWTFRCNYPSVLAATNYTYDQRMEVRDFQDFAGVIQSIELYDFETGIPVQSLCDSDRVQVRVQLDPGQMAGLTWNLRAHWQLEGYGYDPKMLLKRPFESPQEQAYPSPPGVLAQLADTPLEMVPAEFDGTGLAVFVFNHSSLSIGDKPRLYVIAEPVQTVCDFYNCDPNDGEVLGVLRSDEVAAIEAGPPTIGDAYLIIDLPNATPPGATLEEENTGNVILWQGASWLVIDIPPGSVIVDGSTGKRWAVHPAVDGTTLYPSGKFAIPWLYQARDGNGSAPHGGGAPALLFFSPYTLKKIAGTYLSTCRSYVVEVDAPGGSVVWIPTGGQTELAAYTGTATTFTNINVRVRWECDGDVQGYSDVQNFV